MSRGLRLIQCFSAVFGRDTYRHNGTLLVPLRGNVSDVLQLARVHIIVTDLGSPLHRVTPPSPPSRSLFHTPQPRRLRTRIASFLQANEVNQTVLFTSIRVRLCFVLACAWSI